MYLKTGFLFLKRKFFKKIKSTEKINIVITMPFEKMLTPLIFDNKNIKKKNPKIRITKLSQLNIFFKKFNNLFDITFLL